MELHSFIPKLVSMILSWLDASNLRNKLYESEEKIELTKVALDDIIRMSDDKLVREIAERTLSRLN